MPCLMFSVLYNDDYKVAYGLFTNYGEGGGLQNGRGGT